MLSLWLIAVARQLVFLGSLTVILGYAAFRSAAVAEKDWYICLLGLGLVSVCYWLLTARLPKTPPLGKWLAWPAVLLPCYVAFQLVPLPLSVLGALSPQRAELARALGSIVPGIHS